MILLGPCESPAELANTDNYSVFVRAECDPQAADCLSRLPETQRNLAMGTNWRLELNVDGCTGGALVRIEPVPPAGSKIDIEFVVATEENRETTAPESSLNSDQPSNSPMSPAQEQSRSDTADADMPLEMSDAGMPAEAVDADMPN